MTGLHPPTVHVIDDDASVRASTQWLLRSAGYAVELYPDAASFLAAAPEGPGCILLDLRMPGMDGLALQAQLERAGNDLPVIFLTAHGDVSSSVRAMKAGAADFLQKPCEPEALLAAVSAAMARSVARVAEQAELDELRTRWAALTDREREVATHVVAGRRNKEIAAELGVVEQTVKVHRARVMQKARVASVADLVRLAIAIGVAPKSTPVPPHSEEDAAGEE